MEQRHTQLRPYERHAACAIAALLTAIGLLASLENSRLCASKGEPISVHVVGAVRECELLLPQGSSLDDVISRVVLDEKADCSEFDGSRRIVNKETIVIPFSGATTVYVTGAVKEPKVVVLEKAAKPKDVLQLLDLTEDADLSQLSRRRVLRNGSVIDIKRKMTKPEAKGEIVGKDNLE